MRFIAFRTNDRNGVAALVGERALDLTKLDPTLGPDLSELIARGSRGLRWATEQLATHQPDLLVADLSPALPVRRPGKIFCLGLNYVDHAKEGGFEVPDYPALFMRSANSLIADGDPVVRPMVSERLDYEAELMVIIGEGGRHISEANALDHVFGYTLFNDVSVRDYQRKTHQWTPGKNFDGTGALGPIVVTPDELPKGAKGLRIQSRLNGQIMQDDKTDNMVFHVAETIATVSEFATLEPGDLIAMGTPQGVGHARTPPVWMRPGDRIEIEIDQIGLLSNPIVDETELRQTEAAE